MHEGCCYDRHPRGAVANRLAELLESTNQQLFAAVPDDDSRIDGYLSVERRLLLAEGEYAEITGLVIDSAARRSSMSERRPRMSTVRRSEP
ncbi:hypothetical protein [Sciscionella sediminilitoris]|uniref:hypothetical protein n=1 Tax=Sciscionella sediminilitoris TaxID=1445613 RepID=UPI0012E26172|nr:hypothetical protein [Sciscionella sp. SE31]